MFRDGNAERVRRLFADQFEPDRMGRYLYRKSFRDAPVRVSAAERDRFILAYQRAYRRMIWAGVTILVLVSFASVAFAWPRHNTERYWTTGGGVAVTMAVLFLLQRRAWNAPARALAPRSVEGGRRSRAEVSRLMLARTSYGRIVGNSALAGIMLVSQLLRRDLARGWKTLSMAALLLVIALTARGVFRKWRSEHSLW